MFLRLLKKIDLGLLLLHQKEVEMIVEAGRSRLCTRGQLRLPLLSMTNTVNVHAGNEDAARSVRALDPSLSPHNVPNQRQMNTREFAQIRLACSTTSSRLLKLPLTPK